MRLGATDPGALRSFLAAPGDVFEVTGSFVGSGQDGPRGVIGWWSLTAPGTARGSAKLGSDMEIIGAFGAELP